MSRRCLALFVCLLAAAPAFAQAPAAAAPPSPPTNDDCMMCHNDPEAKRANGTSIAVQPDAFGKSIHAGLSCVDCHQDLAANPELPHAEKLEKVSCQTCHDEPVAQFDRSVHHDRAAKDGKGATCVSCHGMHDILPKSDPDSKTYPLNLPSTCAACHGGQHLEGAPGTVADSFADSVHGKGLQKSGLLVSANCSSCHNAHDVRRKGDPDSPVHRSNIAKTCATCHQGIESVFVRSVHGQQMASGNMAAAVCSDCHTSHKIKRADTEGWKLAVIDECGTCHVDKTATYRDTYHGKVTALGFERIAACKDCHGSHDILPASNPMSMVSKARVVSTCQTCHPGANENFAKYDPHADKHDVERSPVLYWAARFMEVLLAGVFLFFGAHTLLWFPRSLKARRERQAAERGARQGETR